METPASPNLFPCDPRTDGPAWRAAEAVGIDMTLVVAALRLPVSERLRRHDLALTAALVWQEAFIKEHGLIWAN